MPRINIEQKAMRGAVYLLLRQVAVQAIGVIVTVVLSRMLTPYDFGMYAMVSTLMSFLTVIGDAGLAAGLIQMEEEPDRSWYITAFSVAQLFYIVVTLGAVVVELLLRAHNSHNRWQLFIILALVTAYLTTYRMIPAAKLERDLVYSKLSMVELVEGLSFQIAVLVFAFSGFGIWSFIFGALARTLLGVVLINLISPFLPGLRFDWGQARVLLRFGLFQQGASMVGFIRESIVPVMIGSVLGPAAVGIVTWAQKLSSYPTLPLNPVNRIMFPSLSRASGESSEVFRRLLNQLALVYAVILYGLTGLIFIYLPDVVRILYSAKWLGAVPLTYLLLTANLTIAFAFPIFAGLSAKGESKYNFWFTLAQLLVMWIIGYPAIREFGVMGFGYIYVLMQGVGIWVLRVGRDRLGITFSKVFIGPVIGLCMMILIAYIQRSCYTVHSPLILLLSLILPFAAYLLCVYSFSIEVRKWVNSLWGIIYELSKATIWG